ncbi:MAG: hypothetical protein ACE5KI_07520, partial [Dehalococcoidia bacterium]
RPLTWVRATRDEFRVYVERYGVARVVFPHSYRVRTRTLAKSGEAAVAIEVGTGLFFIPFHTTNRDAATARDIVELVSVGVIEYRRKMKVEIPEWLDGFAFAKEEELKRERVELERQVTELERLIGEWRDYKAMLVTSGDLLKTRVVAVLERFFGLKVDPIDEGREDLKILEGPTDAAVIALGEVKGTSGGIRREHVTQADTHRERNGLEQKVPGLLIINSQMDVNSIEERVSTTVASEQVKLARTLNILIIRAVDLLRLMKLLEGDEARGEKLLELINGGGGLLRVNSEGYRIVTE